MPTITSEWSNPTSFTVEFFETLPDEEFQKIISQESASANNFGLNFALDGASTTLVIGEPGVTVNGKAKAGAVHVYSKVNNVWTRQVKLVPDDHLANDEFGTAVAINEAGTMIVASSPFKPTVPASSNSGLIYTFKKNGSIWTQTDKVTTHPGHQSAGGGAGKILKLSDNGEWLIAYASAYNHYKWVDGSGWTNYPQGSVQFFRRHPTINKWVLRFKTTDGVENIGRTIAISSNGLRVAVMATHLAGEPSRVKIYERLAEETDWPVSADSYSKDWSFKSDLNGAIPNQSNGFGQGLCFSNDGDVLLVGNTLVSQTATEAPGEVCLYRYNANAWSIEKTFRGPKSPYVNTSSFGKSISLSQDNSVVLIGASSFYPEANMANAGQAYVFKKENNVWTLKYTLRAADRQSSSYLAEFVLLSRDGRSAFLSSRLGSVATAGAVYVFK